MSKNILETIADYARERVAAAKEIKPLELLKREAEQLEITDFFPFEKALGQEGISFIC